MKNIFKILSAFLPPLALMTWIFACNKLPTRQAIEASARHAMNSLGVNDTGVAYKTVILSDNQNISSSDSSHHVSVNAIFLDSLTGNAANITGLSVNGRSFPRKADSSFAFSYSDTSNTTIQNEGLALAGTTVKIKVTGTTAADTATQSLYLPKTPLRTTTDWPIMFINVLNNQTVYWVSDPANTTGLVTIKVWYSADFSKALTGNASLPATDRMLTYTVTDNGTYTIPSADLQGFKAGSYISIMIGRGDQGKVTLPISQKNVYFFTAASGSTNSMYVQCAENWQNTGTPLRCKVGSVTGEQEQEQRDLSICSATYNQTRWVSSGTTSSACLPCNPSTCTGNSHKCINNLCETGSLVVTSVVKKGSNCVTSYSYQFSDGSLVFDHNTTTPASGGMCPIIGPSSAKKKAL